MTKIDDEIRASVKQFRDQGKSEREIAKELQISKTSVHDILTGTVHPGKPPGSGKSRPGAGSPRLRATSEFFDAQKRMDSLIGSYGIADAGRIVEYISSVPGAYEDPELLRKSLGDQLVAPGRVDAIVKHWARLEGLQVPTLPGNDPDSSQWDIENTGGVWRPIRDPSGPYNFDQARSVSRDMNNRQPGNDGQNNEVKELRAELERRDKEELKAEIASLRSEIAASRQPTTSTGRTSLDLMSEGLTKIERVGQGVGTELSRLFSELRGERLFMRAAALNATVDEISALTTNIPTEEIRKQDQLVFALYQQRESSPEIQAKYEQEYSKLHSLRATWEQRKNVLQERIRTRPLPQLGDHPEASAAVVQGRTEMLVVECTSCQQSFKVDLYKFRTSDADAVECPNCRATVAIGEFKNESREATSRSYVSKS